MFSSFKVHPWYDDFIFLDNCKNPVVIDLVAKSFIFIVFANADWYDWRDSNTHAQGGRV